MNKLKKVLSEEDTILFIGSGISVWSGLPTWTSMIEELARYVESLGGDQKIIRAELEKGDLLQAASYGIDFLTRQQIGKFIRSACRYGIAKPHEIHRKIVTLGPRCFITTNYDDLIEQSLRLWQPNRFYAPPVTNRHVTELAEIVHARAIDFVFKPHGDASDNESIVLTREQYRQLLPQGERYVALDALKMLLASRPVVYLGFGLRDPDFSYIRDLLLNTYKGAVRDHYAVMPDVSSTERDYWRRNYGIHLVSYETKERSDKGRDHSALLELLDLVHGTSEVKATVKSFDPKAPEVKIALARYAAGLSRVPRATPEFEIRVHQEIRESSRHQFPGRNKFDHALVETFLDEGPDRAILVGLPGAGKSYSLRRAVVRLAERLHAACFEEHFDEAEVVIPIFADLKLYDGDLKELLSRTLSKSLPLDELTHHFKVKFFIDSFNEMPREFWEDASYESDFSSFLSSVPGASVIIGSRTSDGLTKLGLPEYKLDQIDEDSVSTALEQSNIQIEGRFAPEVRSLLHRPFFFQHVIRGSVRLPTNAHPRDFYAVFFNNLRSAFLNRFGVDIDIEQVLSVAGYEALNRGEEAFPLSDLQYILQFNLSVNKIDVKEVVNWLAASSVLVPYIGGRVAFVHQSLTEYLAASELARRYEATPQVLTEKLTLSRWDQAIFLTLSLLPAEKAPVFFDHLVKANFILALSAVKYLEINRDEVVSKLLVEIPKRKDQQAEIDEIQWILEDSLPISETHESELRAIIDLRDSIGGSAVIRLAELKGIQLKDELIELLLAACDDFNFCANGVGPALAPLVKQKDLHLIAKLSDSLNDGTSPASDDFPLGFVAGAARTFENFDISVVRKILLPKDKSALIPPVRAEIINEILWHRHSTAALELAAELLMRGVDSAVTSIYFIANRRIISYRSFSVFTHEHIERLLKLLKDPELWALRALRTVCEARKDFARLLRTRASVTSGIERAALLYCANPVDTAPIFDAISEYLQLDASERSKEPTHLLKQMEIDWSAERHLLIESLKIEDASLASAIIYPLYSRVHLELEELDFGEIDWLLLWMLQLEQSDETGLLVPLGHVVGNCVDDAGRAAILAEFNRHGSRFRSVLLENVLPYLRDITSDSFTDDAISFLLSDLNQGPGPEGHLIGNIATEHFVTYRLLPLLSDTVSPFGKI
jgi:SIR2-like domain